MTSTTALDRHRDYLAGAFTMADAVEETLAAIRDAAELNAYLATLDDSAREAARELDARRERGDALGPLAGAIIAIKDNIVIRGETPTTCASHILENFASPYDATVIRKIREADGIIIGKTNLDEFAMGSSTENSSFGPSRNPANPEYVAGGSSGGSAVAVAAGLADISLGSDTGGSIRQPASFCGVVGLKPTYGRVSRYGLVAFASSLDQIGPFARSVGDAARMLTVISGVDPNDSTSVDQAVPDYLAALDRDISGMTVGIPAEYFGEGLAPDVRAAVDGMVAKLAERGVSARPVSLPMTQYAIATYYIIATAEASSNLARYDGVRYGVRTAEAGDLESMYVRTRSEGFGEEVKRRIMLGTYVLSAGYYDAYYRKAQQVRRLIRDEFDRVFSEVDLILTPTTPTPAFKLGEKTADPLQMYLSDIYTVTTNLAGICGINVPCGTDAQGLPIGLQLIGGLFQEEPLLAMAHAVEQLRNDG